MNLKKRSICVSFLFLLATYAASVSGQSLPDCECRDSAGNMQSLGTVQCVPIGTRNFLLRCEMSQNNPYWARLSDSPGCPAA